jgi:NAD-dependent deacetylase
MVKQLNKIETAARILKCSNNVVVFTGAGMSTESGIPDFRSKTGIYETMIPETFLSITNFMNNPYDVYKFFKHYINIQGIKPNKGHDIIAEWERDGLVKSVITQNIDRLHQKAGSKDVVQVHGEAETATCIHCKKQYDTLKVIEGIDNVPPSYVCDCMFNQHAYIKPNIVFFEEDVEMFPMAVNKITRADALIILGTSLKVYPVASLIDYLEPMTPVIIINKDKTSIDNRSNLIAIHESIGETLEEINKLLKKSE